MLIVVAVRSSVYAKDGEDVRVGYEANVLVRAADLGIEDGDKMTEEE